MTLRDRLAQKADWHRAELTVNDDRRRARRDEHDARWGMCQHGTHKADECRGDEGR